MVNRDSLTGLSSTELAEIRMWFSFATLVAVAMSFMRWIGFLDYFRLIFFCSPAWLTILVAPFQTDHSSCKLLSYSSALFLAYWFTVHAYPSQCRQAWGTEMVTDEKFWGQSDAMVEAIMQEKDSYFVKADVTDRERGMFWPKPPDPSSLPPATPAEEEKEAMNNVMDKVGTSPESQAKDVELVQHWVGSWSGGLSKNLLKLRAYCGIHQGDAQVPHVYPLRVLGVLNNQANWTAPCPYWTCLMTEARPKGKLAFLATIGGFSFLNYVHSRCACSTCTLFAWYFGAGTPRLWWWWLWAALLPLTLVMLIKTTCDEELLVVVSKVIHHFTDPVLSYALDGPNGESHLNNRIQLFVLLAILFVMWKYRQKIRMDLGLEGFTLMSLVGVSDGPGGGVLAEPQMTFHVSIWRVDVTSNQPAPNGADIDQLSDGDEEAETGTSPKTGARGLMLCGAPSSAIVRRTRWRGLSGLFRRQEDMSTMKTPNGQAPTLCVKFFYGMEEVQSTRSVRPTSTQWWEHEPVYFQEHFHISVDHRPRTGLRIEIRDTSTGFGSMCLGSVNFDESSLEHMFEGSKSLEPMARQYPVPVMQVMQMSNPPPISVAQEEQQIVQLKNIGFQQHRLTDGGAIWLAFYESEDDHHAPTACC